MARKSQRLSAVRTSNIKHKRAASGSTVPASGSKRSKNDQATPLRSRYFAGTADEDDRNEGDNDGSADGENEAPSATDETASEFGDGDGEIGLHESAESAESSEDNASESVDEATTSGKTKPHGRKSSAAIQIEKGGSFKPTGKTELRPGTQVVTKKPKARPAGKTPYEDETIHPNTLLFLADLKANNKREWLKSNDAEFRQAEKDWHSFVEKMTEKLTEADDTIPELPIKDVIFRIYRDIRFSKDPTPYKVLIVHRSRAGRKSAYAHYYVQIAPGNSFVGGGLWMPESAPTAAMRQSIDRHPRRLKDVLLDDDIRDEFLNGAAKTDVAAVKAFVNSNSENALKAKPKGFDAGHADIALLRLRNFTIGRNLTDEEVLGEAGMERIAQLLATLTPFITYLNSVVQPDEPSEDDEDQEDDEEE